MAEIRPAAVAGVGLVFVITLLDPAAPLVLGLRRTAGFQVVFQALRPDPFPGVASIVLLALLAAILGKTLLRWLGGRGTALPYRAPDPNGGRELGRLDLRAGRLRSVASALLVAAWAMLAWFPVVGLARLAVRSVSQTEERVDPAGVASDLLIRRLSAPPIPRLMLFTVFLALAVIAAIRILAWLEAGRRARAPGRERSRRALLTSVPTLAWGVGILAIPRVADLASRLVRLRHGMAACLWRAAAPFACDRPIPHPRPVVVSGCLPRLGTDPLVGLPRASAPDSLIAASSTRPSWRARERAGRGG